MFKLRRYLAGHVAECVVAPLFKMLEALLQLLLLFQTKLHIFKS